MPGGARTRHSRRRKGPAPALPRDSGRWEAAWAAPNPTAGGPQPLSRPRPRGGRRPPPAAPPALRRKGRAAAGPRPHMTEGCRDGGRAARRHRHHRYGATWGCLPPAPGARRPAPGTPLLAPPTPRGRLGAPREGSGLLAPPKPEVKRGRLALLAPRGAAPYRCLLAEPPSRAGFGLRGRPAALPPESRPAVGGAGRAGFRLVHSVARWGLGEGWQGQTPSRALPLLSLLAPARGAARSRAGAGVPAAKGAVWGAQG